MERKAINFNGEIEEFPREEKVISNENIDIKKEEVMKENNRLKEEIKQKEEIINIFKKQASLISHDLRGPIGNINSFADLLLDELENGEFDKENAQKYLQIIKDMSQGSLDLLEKLLIWSRLQMNGIKLELAEVPIRGQIIDAVTPLIGSISKKNINLNYDIKVDTSAYVDQNMFQTVIRNLVSNAIKFTNEGGHITIKEEDIDNLIKIYIEDDGVGIDKENQEKIFNAMSLTTKGTNNETGSGLGLSMCKEMIEKMNGHIEVSSDGKGKGTTFTISIPKSK